MVFVQGIQWQIDYCGQCGGYWVVVGFFELQMCIGEIGVVLCVCDEVVGQWMWVEQYVGLVDLQYIVIVMFYLYCFVVDEVQLVMFVVGS